MIEKFIFLGHHPVINTPSQEVISGSGLGSSGQWIIILIVILLIWIFLYFSRKKK